MGRGEDGAMVGVVSSQGRMEVWPESVVKTREIKGWPGPGAWPLAWGRGLPVGEGDAQREMAVNRTSVWT